MKKTIGQLRYPREIYVQRQQEADGTSYLDAERDIRKAAVPGQEIEVAIYQLVRVAKVTAPVLIINAGRKKQRDRS
jgi:hypothetical protein